MAKGQKKKDYYMLSAKERLSFIFDNYRNFDKVLNGQKETLYFRRLSEQAEEIFQSGRRILRGAGLCKATGISYLETAECRDANRDEAVCEYYRRTG